MIEEFIEEINRLLKELSNIGIYVSYEQLRMPRIDVFRVEKKTIRTPYVEVVDKDDKYEITVEIPGISKEDVEVYVSENKKKLIIRAYGKDRKYYAEIPLLEPVDEKNARATYVNGVLKIELPKGKEEIKGYKITVT